MVGGGVATPRNDGMQMRAHSSRAERINPCVNAGPHCSTARPTTQPDEGRHIGFHSGLPTGMPTVVYPLGFTTFVTRRDRGLLGFTGFYWVLLGFTGFYWVIPGLNGCCIVV